MQKESNDETLLAANKIRYNNLRKYDPDPLLGTDKEFL